MKKWLMLCLGLVLCAASAHAGEYHYVSQDDMKKWLESNKEMVIVDIQPAKDFARQHFAGAVETNAFPVENDAERHRLDHAVEVGKGNNKDVVVVCPRGKGGAKRCYDFLRENGIAPERLYILTDGMDKWPYKELVRSQQ
jgi:rhodanese-related sulfurtransferase